MAVADVERQALDREFPGGHRIAGGVFLDSIGIFSSCTVPFNVSFPLTS
jgi:hypothetical protein